MTGRLEGRRTLVVGAGGGIGRAIAEAFAAEGARVACGTRDLGAAEAMAAHLRDRGGSAVGVYIDLLEPDTITAGVATAVDLLGGLDCVVQSGGITATTAFVDIALEEWRRVLATNLDGTFLTCQAAARALKEQGGGGSIIVVTSQLAQVAIPNKAHYLASKGALSMLVKSMALELAPDGIRVNALAPGVTETDMAMSRLAHDDDAMAWTIGRIPLGRLGQPEEMGGAAVYLASDEASYVTGSTILIDGGYLVR